MNNQLIAYKKPASIEGEQVDLKFRKLNPGRPYKHTGLSCLIYPYTLSQNAEAEITKELNPKIGLIDPKSSLLDLGVGIKGKTISIIVKKILGRISVSKGSHTHKAQYVTTHSFCYARLDLEFSGVGTRKL